MQTEIDQYLIEQINLLQQQNSLLAIFQPDGSPDPHLQIRGKKELSIRVLSFSCLSPST